MQVGDLVTLSSAGKKNKGNDLVLGKMGIILEIRSYDTDKYPYVIRWFNATTLDGARGILRTKRYEIKKV